MEKVLKVSIIFDNPKLGYVVHIVYTKYRKKEKEILFFVGKSELKKILEEIMNEI